MPPLPQADKAVKTADGSADKAKEEGQCAFLSACFTQEERSSCWMRGQRDLVELRRIYDTTRNFFGYTGGCVID